MKINFLLVCFVNFTLAYQCFAVCDFEKLSALHPDDPESTYITLSDATTDNFFCLRMIRAIYYAQNPNELDNCYPYPPLSFETKKKLIDRFGKWHVIKNSRNKKFSEKINKLENKDVLLKIAKGNFKIDYKNQRVYVE